MERCENNIFRFYLCFDILMHGLDLLSGMNFKKGVCETNCLKIINSISIVDSTI